MGIKGLQSYISYVDRNCPREDRTKRFCDLAKEARNYRRRAGREPVIVADGLCCMLKLENELDWVYGGQWAELLDKMRNFVDSFTIIGITLVFMFDGSIGDTKRQVWIDRKKKKAVQVKKAYDHIKTHSKTPPKAMKVLPPASSLVRQFLKTLDAQVLNTKGEADREIYEYCQENKCWGVLTTDSDFIIYDSGWYFSVDGLDLNEMTTCRYDRAAFCRSTGLHIHYDLPLLASCIGTDMVPKSKLESFHKKLMKSANPKCPTKFETRGDQELIHNIVYYLKSEKAKGTESYNETVHMIAQEICQNRNVQQIFVSSVKSYLPTGVLQKEFKHDSLLSKGETELEGAAEMKSSLGSAATAADGRSCAASKYAPPKIDPEVMKLALQRHLNCDNLQFVYNVMCGIELDSGVALEDGTDPTIPSCTQIYAPIRQRIIGVLLGVGTKVDTVASTQTTGALEDIRKELPTSPGSGNSGDPLLANVNAVIEWNAYPGNKLEKPEITEGLPLNLPGGTPTLKKLWMELPQGADLQWQALADCMQCRIPLESLRELENHLVLPVCILHFLAERDPYTILQPPEINAFVATITSDIIGNGAELKKLNVGEVNSRGVHLTTVFTRGVTLAMNAISACGYPILMEDVQIWQYFDGRLFHSMLPRAYSGTSLEDLCADGMSNHARKALALRDVIVDGTRMVKLF